MAANLGMIENAERLVPSFGAKRTYGKHPRYLETQSGYKLVKPISYQIDLLVAMAERAGQALTRDQIMEIVIGRELEVFDRSIDVHMGRIQKAIEADHKTPEEFFDSPWRGRCLCEIAKIT